MRHLCAGSFRVILGLQAQSIFISLEYLLPPKYGRGLFIPRPHRYIQPLVKS